MEAAGNSNQKRVAAVPEGHGIAVVAVAATSIDEMAVVEGIAGIEKAEPYEMGRWSWVAASSSRGIREAEP